MATESRADPAPNRSIMLSKSASRIRRLVALLGHFLLFLVALTSAVIILFIFYFIIRDAVPFFRIDGFREFFTRTAWYPSAEPPHFGALPIFFGSAVVTLGAIVIAVPLGVLAAVCLSDVLPFRARQWVKPIIEILAAIPSVAYGFFALVILAPALQNHGATLLSAGAWIILGPLALVGVIVASDVISSSLTQNHRLPLRIILLGVLGALVGWALLRFGLALGSVKITSGTNALNACIILGIMALPTVVSVSEDSLSAVGNDLREGSYALGATRAETLLKVIIPAARSGILAAVILGIMRAIGETMVVWMASGNAAHIPKPWYDLTQPVRTLTATIAGDMGEADQVTGSARFHVLFAMALCLLVICFVCNLVGEWFLRRTKRKLKQ